MKPTVSGYYWYRPAWISMRTNSVQLGRPEMVYVSMSYMLRSRVVPSVLRMSGGAERLDRISEHAVFHGPLECPWKE